MRKGLTLGLIIVSFSLFLLVQYLADPNIYTTNDLNGNILSLAYIKHSLASTLTFPQWNFYINQGLPLVADPLSSYLNPIVFSMVMLLPIELAIKIIYLSAIALSGFTMFLLLRKLAVYPHISLLLALTYMSSGYVASRIIAGHFEKILSYPLLPLALFLLLAVTEKRSLFWCGLLALSLSLILFSADLYNVLYLSLLIIGVGMYQFIVKRSMPWEIILSLLLFAAFSSIKILPLLELQEFISKVREPYLGSQNVLSIFYYVFFPVKPIFQLFGIDPFITKDFGWWEKIAFIGPGILIGLAFLLSQYKLIQSKHLMLLLVSTGIILLLSMPDLIINPYHYLIRLSPLLQSFHVPSRTFGLLSVLLLSLCGIGITHFLKHSFLKANRIVILLVITNLLIVFTFFQLLIYTRSFPVTPASYGALIEAIPTQEDSITLVGQSLLGGQLPQHHFIGRNEKLMYNNYGLQIKDSPASHFTRYDFGATDTYTDIVPRYFLTTSSHPLPETFKVLSFKKLQNATLYELTNYTPYTMVSTTSAEVISTNIKPNKITAHAHSSTSSAFLTILENYYPGWELHVDGARARLTDDRFLKAPLLRGTHTYTLSFSSQTFAYGLLITIASILLWIIYVAWNRKPPHREHGKPRH